MLALQTVCCHNFSFYFFIVRNALLEWALTCNTKNLCNDCCRESTCSLTNLLQKEFKKAGHLFKEWLEWLKHSKNIHQVANLLAQSPVFSLCINYSLTKLISLNSITVLLCLCIWNKVFLNFHLILPVRNLC